MKIDLVEEVYYFKHVFHLPFFFISCSCQNRITDDVVYYLKQVFHLLYDKSVTPAEVLFSFTLILQIVVKYDI